ncbi:hypothetical protein M0R45_029822 [Rubus argutus]|uniref:Pentatricopeptide repeat-containing protein n=1 Tax=Rubus argutus TaxID=59490 RepID=A0AAW1W8U8_RUBAR
MTTTSTTLWNTRLRELAKQCLFSESLNVYRQMLRFGHPPNASTFPFALKSCAALSLPITGYYSIPMFSKPGASPIPSCKPL